VEGFGRGKGSAGGAPIHFGDTQAAADRATEAAKPSVTALANPVKKSLNKKPPTAKSVRRRKARR